MVDRAGKLEDAHAGREQLVVERATDAEKRGVIGFFGDEQPHVHSAGGAKFQRGQRHAVRDKITGGQPGSRARVIKHRDQGFLHRLGWIVRSSGENQGRGLAATVAGRIIAGLLDFLVGGEIPVVGETFLQGAGERAGELGLQVAPGADLGVEALVFDADVHAADKRDVAVDDLHLAMIAQIKQVAMPARVEREKPGEFSARRHEFLEVVGGQQHGADFIQKDAHLYAATGGGHERVAQTPARLVLAPDEKLDVHVIFRGVDALFERIVKEAGIR